MGANFEPFVIRSMFAGDISAVTQIHLESFPDSRSSKLGKVFVKKMYRWFVEKHPALAFVAVVDDQPVGFVTGSIGSTGRRIFRYALPEIAWGFLRHPGLLFEADMFEAWQNFLSGLLPMISFRKDSTTQQPVQEKVLFVKAVLASIAVSPRGRGKNVGKSLVGMFEIAAIKRGATVLALGVELDNPAARRLYESCGWVLMHEDPAHNSANYIKRITRE